MKGVLREDLSEELRTRSYAMQEERDGKRYEERYENPDELKKAQGLARSYANTRINKALKEKAAISHAGLVWIREPKRYED